MRSASEAFSGEDGVTLLEVRAWWGRYDLGLLPVGHSWSVSDSDDENIPGRLEFEVPNTVEWRPKRTADPLAAKGHRFEARIGRRLAGSRDVEWLPVGWFNAHPAEASGDVLRVTGVGLLELVDLQRFLYPFRGVGTKWAVVGRLLGGILPHRSVGLTDEPMGATVWEENRLEALREVADAWPARIKVTDAGVVEFRPPYDDMNPGEPVAGFRDGYNLVSVQFAPDTSNQFNAYRVSTVPDGDAAPVSEVWTLPNTDLWWGGPWGFRPGYFASPLLTPDRVKLRSIAQGMTLRAQRRADAYDVTVLPDPRIECGDVVVVEDTRDPFWMKGRVVSVAHSRTSTQMKLGYLEGSR